MPRIEIVSCDSIILRYEERITEEILDRVQRDYLKIKTVAGVIEAVPSYASLWVRFDRICYSLEEFISVVEQRLRTGQTLQRERENKLHEVVVDYGRGIDLERIASMHQMDVEEIIEIHTNPLYRIYAIGFMVGFAYMGSVDQRIATPRLLAPRERVPKGSVAIANAQTAIYPCESSGGWNIVGVTDFDDFSTFSVGDRVRFVRG